jgi:aryl sulfotransferase
VPQSPVRYRSADEDSARWVGFPFRERDIVISTRSRSGTTWMQMVCALLVFQTPELPAPLGLLSPWLDWLVTPRDEIYARLAAQEHRRFIKTHTPLDGIPLDPRATYIVVARPPLDMAVSLYHQGDNIDRGRMRQLLGQPEGWQPASARLPLREWLLEWIDRETDPREELDSLAGVLWHLSDAWARRKEPNVVLAHYDLLSADLEGEMRHLAQLLGITVPDETWPALVQAATFERMRAGAVKEDRFFGPQGLLKSRAAFFRRGTTGSGREILTDDELAHYHARTAEMAPPDLLTWLHSPGHSRSPR